MRKEKNNNDKNNIITKRKWLSIIGFLISIVLLSIAITISMNEEKISREAKVNKEALNQLNRNIIVLEQASSSLSKDINEVKNQEEENKSSNVISNENTITNSNESNTTNTNAINTNTEINENNNNSSNQGKINEDNEANNNQEAQKFIMPIEGEHLTSYSMDSLVYSNTLGEWITHRGIDIKAEKTTVVKASASGTVKAIKNDPRYGLSITIEHNDGFQTVYSSLLSTEFVKEGDTVEQGKSIGTVGNSAVFETADGSHLHFELLKDGEYINPDIYLK